MTVREGDRVLVATKNGDVKGVATTYSFVFSAWYVKGDDGVTYFADPGKVRRIA